MLYDAGIKLRNTIMEEKTMLLGNRAWSNQRNNGRFTAEEKCCLKLGPEEKELNKTLSLLRVALKDFYSAK